MKTFEQNSDLIKAGTHDNNIANMERIEHNKVLALDDRKKHRHEVKGS